MKNRQVWLRSRPNGIPQAATLISATSNCRLCRMASSSFTTPISPPIPLCAAGSQTRAPWPRIEVGDTMRAFAAGEVVESRNPAYAAGDKVMGIFGWQDYSAVKQPQVMRKVLETDLPLSLSLGYSGSMG